MKYQRILNPQKDIKIGYHLIILDDPYSQNIPSDNDPSELEKFLDSRVPQRVVGGHVSQNWGQYIKLENGDEHYVDDFEYIFYAGVDNYIPPTPIIKWYSGSIMHVAAKQGGIHMWSYGDKLLSREDVIEKSNGNTIFPYV